LEIILMKLRNALQAKQRITFVTLLLNTVNVNN